MNKNYSFEAADISSWVQTHSYIFLFIVLAVVIGILLLALRKFLNFRKLLNEEQVFLELTPPAFTDKSAYTTQQLFSVLHSIGRQLSFLDRLLGRKALFSFEIVSTRKDGIRYIIKTIPEHSDSIKRTIVSYLPYVKVKQVREYLPEGINPNMTKIVEFKLRKHFAFPLAKQNVLNQHDPVAYITGMMTQLKDGELVALQIVTSPTVTTQTSILNHKILRNEDVLRYLNKSNSHWMLNVLAMSITFVFRAFQEVVWFVIDILTSNPRQERDTRLASALQQQLSSQNLKPVRVLSTFEQEVVASIQEKIDQPLFETTIRACVLLADPKEQRQRVQEIKSSLATFSVPKSQALQAIYTLPYTFIKKLQYFAFKHRLLSLFSNSNNSLLSVSEIAALYHFPFSKVTQTENIVKVHSKKLPAPLSLKQDRDLQVIFGKNTYNESNTPIGLTEKERETHMYVIGRTGSGKTTMLYSMALSDIEQDRGMAFIDPHGDVSEELVKAIPKERMNDLIYINPIDLKYPIGINLLELTPGIDDDEAELEKEVVAEGVISLFRKVFSNDENANPHRIEYILRNTIYTAFTIKDATIFTLYDILNNPIFQKQVIAHLEDPYLKNFWKNEFGKAGDFQIVKMVGGVTAKVGRFLFSPTARRILEQKHSTIKFDEILDQGKILICNFSQGNLGEDTARLLGTTVLTKIQQAALRRARLPKGQRRPYYLYVDEFQNFATQSFIKMLSEGRKYGLSVCIAEQSTSQQEDRRIVNNILANVTTVVSFRSANPVDEELMLSQFSPYVAKGDIGNLPRYNFYCKISAIESEEPFSGETILTRSTNTPAPFTDLIEASRKNYAIEYTSKRNTQKKMEISITEPVKTDVKKPATQAKRQQSGSLLRLEQ